MANQIPDEHAGNGTLTSPVVLARRADRLSHRRAHTRARHRSGRARGALQVPKGRDSRHVQHVLGRRAVALHDPRAGHHALHFGLHHHAVDDGRVADPRSAEKRRRIGPPQDHAVHALRHRRACAVPGHGHRDRARVAALARAGARPRVPPDHHDHAGDRHHVPDVARRADYRARHRQRHFTDHFRGHRRGAASPRWSIRWNCSARARYPFLP